MLWSAVLGGTLRLSKVEFPAMSPFRCPVMDFGVGTRSRCRRHAYSF